jgi:hypothetical protein
LGIFSPHFWASCLILQYDLSSISPNLLNWGIAGSLLRIHNAGMFRFLSTIFFESAWCGVHMNPKC